MKTKFLTVPMLLEAGAISLFKRHLLLLLAICVLIPSAQAQSLFVTAQDSNTVAVIDSSTDQVTTQIPVGANPIRICVSPDRRKAYVSNSGSSSVSVIDTVALPPRITATIQVGNSPGENAVTPDGKKLFVVHQSSAPVTVIDTTTNSVIASIPIGGNLAKDILFTGRTLRIYRKLFRRNGQCNRYHRVDPTLPGKVDHHWSRLPSPCPVSRRRPRVRYQLPGQFRVRYRHPYEKIGRNKYSCRHQPEGNCHHAQWRRDLRHQRGRWDCLYHRLCHVDGDQNNWGRILAVADTDYKGWNKGIRIQLWK